MLATILASASAARLWLEVNVHPAAPALLLILAIWAPQYAIRKWRPAWWQWFATFGGRVDPKAGALVEYALKAWQGLPSMMAGALVGSLSTGGDPTGAVVGALLGVCAPAKHHLLKLLPIPYRGGEAPAASPEPPKKLPPFAAALLLALLPGAIALALTLLHGCADYPEVVRHMPDAGANADAGTE